MQSIRVADERECYMSTKSVAKYVDMNARTIRRLVQEGKFPRPFKLNERVYRWKKSEVCEWIERHPRMEMG